MDGRNLAMKCDENVCLRDNLVTIESIISEVLIATLIVILTAIRIRCWNYCIHAENL